ncbi:MAG: Stp1/IreP family PP2C-type Ser/Thr phosphatase [Oscillospiraceae bacterium]|jgi:protein phosphatase|nr:Stp1/IreP family PP2C-type Ser/Thr phosphatase [Oscillospiraceae bacterium]
MSDMVEEQQTMIAWAITDKGLARRENQDSFHLEVSHAVNQALCVVCDGMGGAKSGNVASQMAAGTFMDEMRFQAKPGMSPRAVRTALVSSVAAANMRVYEKAQSSSEFYGMGTTLVGAAVSRGSALIVNVGDSRAYLVDTEGITQITRDHSLVEDLIGRGELSREEAKVHPSKNLITRALGTEAAVIPDLFTVELREGDFLLLCTDGLTNVVDDQEILFEILHGGDPADCCERLKNLANDRGGPDNITLVLVHI